MELTMGFGVEGFHPREWFIRLDKNLYGLNNAGLVWFEKFKKGLEARIVFRSQVDPYVWYKEDMVLLFYVDDYIMFSTYKDKIDDIFTSYLEYFKIEYDRELNKYI